MDVKKLQEFMELVGRLKHMKRTGWVIRNIADPEPIAGHMYRMAMLSFLVDGNEKLDRTKIMQMTLVHDLAECIVGDITPHCGVPVDEKHRREEEAMEEICQLLGYRGPEIMEIFREYESQESPEAKYVKDLDRLDLIMQAFEYEKRDKTPGKLQEFFTATNGKISHPFISKMADEINAQREAFCQQIPKANAQAFDTVRFLHPDLEQRLWPRHCVIDSWGAQLHKDLVIVPGSDKVRKGQNPDMDAYSAFFDNEAEHSTELLGILNDNGITDVYVCGLALDVCVKATCLDGLRLGFRLAVIDDLCRGVDPHEIDEARRAISVNGGLVTNGNDAIALASGKKRSLIMAQRAASALAQKYSSDTN